MGVEGFMCQRSKDVDIDLREDEGKEGWVLLGANGKSYTTWEKICHGPAFVSGLTSKQNRSVGGVNSAR